MVLSRYSSTLFVCSIVQLLSIGSSDDTSHTQRHASRHHHSHTQRWDRWTSWTPCSVDCGIGITSRTRDCRSTIDGRNTTGCVGKHEEIKICEITGCLRAVIDQCAELEDRLFGGTRYRWLPYTHPRNICEAACRPVGAGFYLGLGKNVADGTVCNDEGNKVCISGQCKTLGCDNIVESDAVFDACGVCAGDGTSCDAVRKTFTDDVKYGYHTFATIPRGATNIFISEAANSRNYLAIKSSDGTFQLNTDFRLSRFGERPGVGSLVTYSRNAGVECPDECITIDGPIDADIEVQVLAYSDNKGITYSYNVPDGMPHYNMDKDEVIAPVIYIDGGRVPGTNSKGAEEKVPQEKRPIFSYDFTFEKSDRTHDTHESEVKSETNIRIDDKTHQSIHGENDKISADETTVDQVKLTNDRSENTDDRSENTDHIVTVADDRSENTDHIVTVADDNEQATNHSVIVTGDSEQVSQESEEVTEESIHVSGGNVTIAEESESAGNYSYLVNATDDNVEVSTEATAVTIIETKQPEKFTLAENDVTNKTDALHSSHTGILSGEIGSNVAVGDMYRKDNEIPSLYSWSVSGYTECSSSCGQGKQSPILECIVTDKGVAVDEQFCADLERPGATTTACDYGPCPPSWIADSWSKCSVTCGVGMKFREYTCTREDGVTVSSYECGSSRPDREEEQCDMGSCTTGWYFTEWQEQCSSACGYGTVSRHIQCISNSGNERTACPVREKPSGEKSCRSNECNAVWLSGPWSQCNVTCGMGYQTRDVVCAQKHNGRLVMVSEAGCLDEKPTPYMTCDMPQCHAQWYMNDWSQCSVTCGMGYRSRDVRCLDAQKRHSRECHVVSKPKERVSCENRACPLSDQSRTRPDQSRTRPDQSRPQGSDVVKVVSRPDKPAIHNGCSDQFVQCSMVKSDLCQYKYYQKICCSSCTTILKT